MRVEYYDAILGEAAFRRVHEDLVENIYTLDSALVQAVYQKSDGTVVRLSITTLDRRFKPRFHIPNGRPRHLAVKLGRTTYAGISTQCFAPPERVFVDVAARRLWFYEVYYFGNPGYYQTYYFSYNDCSPIGMTMAFGRLAGPAVETDTTGTGLNESQLKALRDVRRCPPNTLTIDSRPNLPIDRAADRLPFPLGADNDLVRVHPEVQRRLIRGVRPVRRRLQNIIHRFGKQVKGSAPHE